MSKNQHKPKVKPTGRNLEQKINPKISFVDWVRMHKFIFVLITLGMFGIPLLVVQFLYSGFLPTRIITGWNESDLLSYIAGFEALLGTIILSVLALSQTEKIKKDEDFSRIGNTNRPFYVIQKIEYMDEKGNIQLAVYQHDSFCVGEKGTAHIYLKNLGEGVANQTTYIPCAIRNHKNLPTKSIPVGGEFEVLFDYCAQDISQRDNRITIKYENVLGFKYTQEIKVSFEIIEDFIPKEFDHEDLYPNAPEVIKLFQTRISPITPQTERGIL